MIWEVTKRNDWHESGRVKRWIVHRADKLQGICECWDEGNAERIAEALNHSEPKGDTNHEPNR